VTDYGALERALVPRMSEFGITRLADTTGLDRTGIPTASVVKPGTADVIWVYSGKGLSPSQARSVAIMECLERTCALWPSADEVTVAVGSELGTPVWAPDRFTEGSRPISDAAPTPWVAGSRLKDGQTVWLPADLVFTGHRPSGLNAASPFRVRTSNGLGAAFDLESATAHALLEIAERDIVSHYEVLSSHAGVSYLAAVAAHAGIQTEWLSDAYRDDVSLAVTVDANTVPPAALRLVDYFANAGLSLVIKALPNDFQLPAFGVACLEQVTVGEVLGCAGYAVRCNPDDALVAALLELAQTRATDLQGAREDRHDIEKRRLPRSLANHWLATPGEAVPYGETVDQFAPDMDRRLDRIVAAFDAAGLADIAVVEFEAPAGISAVRMLVPGAETWHSTGGFARLGPRLSGKVNHA